MLDVFVTRAIVFAKYIYLTKGMPQIPRKYAGPILEFRKEMPDFVDTSSTNLDENVM